MPEFIFYTTEGFTTDPKGNEIENCQVLGSAYGDNKHQALDNLIKDNPWILKHGFNPELSICRELA